MRVRLERLSLAHERVFLAAARASRALHAPWVSPPLTAHRFRTYVKARSNERNVSYLAFSSDGALLGVVNISEIVLGAFFSAYLGYYVFAPHQKRGVMATVLPMVVTRAFRTHRLHRVEANIQPDNHASLQLVRKLGFRKEGLALRYLKIGGAWRDHERWAITRDEWKRERKPMRAGQPAARPSKRGTSLT
jgi:ribosomal-protein-alanine N-acetyltransferase